MSDLVSVVSHFQIDGTVASVSPLGAGLINDSYRVTTAEPDKPDYLLQRINHRVFTNVELLQHNIIVATDHIRRKLEAAGEPDIDRKVLRLILCETGKTYFFDGENYWRVIYMIPDSVTFEEVTPETSYCAGKAIGDFEKQLADLETTLEETIPNFHNMEYRLQQFHDAVKADSEGLVAQVKPLLDSVERRAEEMCKAERLFREGKLVKRICHCDTKVNNVLFDKEGKVLCPIDLDTVMSAFIFSDYGDFLRYATNPAGENCTDLDQVTFHSEIFEAFTKGYLESARSFLTETEVRELPYAVKLFPYMQAVRFLTDYISGSKYYKIQYPEHNLNRTKVQMKLLEEVEAKEEEITAFIRKCLE
jgi:Ser/Thr protein kinase RdoA (MazF antagonist)